MNSSDNITVLVNDPCDIQQSQTTAMLIGAAVRQGHHVGVMGVGDLSCHSDGSTWAKIRSVNNKGEDLGQLVKALAEAQPKSICLDQTDVILIRTNPARARDRAPMHNTALSLVRHCQGRGVRVINQPDGLIRAATKLYLLELPEFTRPQTLVSQDRQEISTFIQTLEGPAVLKPLQGTRGSDVFKVNSVQDQNLNQIMDVILRQGFVMVQGCIPGAEAGDTRVVVFNGEILELNGKAAAIQRVPKKGDFRSNLHAGGQAQPATITDAMREVVTAIGPKLMNDGLSIVGLDFIGSQLIEINVFSTGGLRDAERFTGKSFADHIIQQL